MRAAFLALLLCGCTGRTEIIIGVATDLIAPLSLDDVQMTVTNLDNNNMLMPPDWPISGIPAQPYDLPGSFGLASSDGSQPRIQIEVVGLKNGTPMVKRTSVVSLVGGKTLFMRMALVQKCTSMMDCGQGKTCVEGVCKTVETDAHTLKDYVADAEKYVDCASGSTLIDTSTGSAMTTAPGAMGQCPPSEHCGEATCYKNTNPFSLCLPPGQVCPLLDDYNQCFTKQCGDKLAMCAGSDWENGNFGGVCADFLSCYTHCNCDQNCESDCEMNHLSADCETCAGFGPGQDSVTPGSFIDCVQQCPSPQCHDASSGAACGMQNGTTKPFFGCSTPADCQSGSVCTDHGDNAFFCKPTCTTDADCTQYGFPQLRCFPQLCSSGASAGFSVCNDASGRLVSGYDTLSCCGG